MLLRIVSILLPVLSIVLIGYVYARRHAPDMVTVNRINMDLFVHALVFVALASKDVQLSQYGWLALGAAGVVLGSGLLAWPLARLLHYFYRDMLDQDALRALAALETLSPSWRTLAEQRLLTGKNEDWQRRLNTPEKS